MDAVEKAELSNLSLDSVAEGAYRAKYVKIEIERYGKYKIKPTKSVNGFRLCVRVGDGVQYTKRKPATEVRKEFRTLVEKYDLTVK